MDERDEAAVRTALMLGANFQERVDVTAGRGLVNSWTIEGFNHRGTKESVAWMYLLTFGLCINADCKPVPCSEMMYEPLDPYSRHDRR